MATLIVVLAIVAGMHFIYEGIIAPSLRDELKDRMFELRDELRAIRMERRNDCPKEAFEIAHNGINQYVNRLHWVTISFITEFSLEHRDPKLRAEVQRRRRIVEECGIPELSDVVKRGNKVVERALLVNSAALLVLALPPVVVAAVATALPKKVYGKAAQLFAAPGKNTERVAERAHYAM